LSLIAGNIFHQQYYNGLQQQLTKENQSFDIPTKTKVTTNLKDNDKKKNQDEDDDRNEVYWMDYKSIRKNQHDSYSGSWYMQIKKFKENVNAERMNTLEDASGIIVYHEN
jgi:hypothetical protein